MTTQAWKKPSIKRLILYGPYCDDRSLWYGRKGWGDARTKVTEVLRIKPKCPQRGVLQD